MEQVSIEL